MDAHIPNNNFEVAARAIEHKKPVPEIDFTLHTMEDGQQVSTQERVCKGMLDSHGYPYVFTHFINQMSKRPLPSHPQKSNSVLHMIAPSPTSSSSNSTFIAKVD